MGDRDQPDARPLILASASPRRHDLLTLLGRPFTILPADIDETIAPGSPPIEAAEHLAASKAAVVARQRPEAVVVGADTIVVLDDDLLNKPADPAEALTMLRRLRGRDHQVVTGLAVAAGDRSLTAHVTARVTMRATDDAELLAYIATGEPLDKAGAYGFQGRGGALVSHVEGCSLTVVGLPIGCLARLLTEIGLPPLVAAASACAQRTGRAAWPGCCLPAAAGPLGDGQRRAAD